MRTMKSKLVLALGTLALGAAVAVPAVAGWGGGDRCDGPRTERMEKRMEQRHQALHDRLKLNASQEKAWQTYTEKMKSLRPAKGEFDREAMSKLSAPERAEKMQAFAEKRLEAMKKGTEAMKAFYATLTPEQKKIFDEEGYHGGARSSPRGGSRGGPGMGR